MYTKVDIVIIVGRVLNGRPEHIIVKVQRLNSYAPINVKPEGGGDGQQ